MSAEVVELAPTQLDALLSLYESEGELTPELVVEAARSTASPLHTAFEWDDRAAADKYRIVQARELLRKAEVVIEERRVRRFVYLPSTSGYHPIDKVVADRDWRAEMIAEFERDAARFEARWANHKHVAEAYWRWKGKAA